MPLFREMTLVGRNAYPNLARIGFALLLTLFALTFPIACGDSSSSSPPVFGNGSLNGTYVFSSAGLYTSSGNLISTMVGSLRADGSGDITGGTVDLFGGNFAIGNPGGLLGAADPITGGTYTVGTDGRGQISFNTTTSAGAVTVTLGFVLISSRHGLVSELDSHGTGSGTIDRQSAITQSELAGSYAFAVSGTTATESPTATVGAFTLDSAGAISTGQEDVNNAGSYSGAPSQILTKSSVILATTPATATIASSAGTSYTFDVYPIDSGHLKFIENDSQRLVTGDAYKQETSIPSGQLVFTLGGIDTIGLPIDCGGWLTSSGAAITAGLEDFNDKYTVGQVNNVRGSISAVSGGRSILNLSGFVNGAGNDTPRTTNLRHIPLLPAAAPAFSYSRLMVSVSPPAQPTLRRVQL